MSKKDFGSMAAMAGLFAALAGTEAVALGLEDPFESVTAKEGDPRKDPTSPASLAAKSKAEAKRARKAAKRRDDTVRSQLGSGTYEEPK